MAERRRDRMIRGESDSRFILSGLIFMPTTFPLRELLCLLDDSEEMVTRSVLSKKHEVFEFTSYAKGCTRSAPDGYHGGIIFVHPLSMPSEANIASEQVSSSRLCEIKARVQT